MGDIGRRSDHVMRNGQRLLLDDARGTTLRVASGRLWITQHHDARDIVLDAGEAWTVERQGMTIVEATRASVVSVSRPQPIAARLLDRALASVRRAFARLPARTTATRFVPYV